MDVYDNYAVSEAVTSNSLGIWDGQIFYLRQFPVWYRWKQVGNHMTGMPEDGSVNGVDFQQSMGRMVFWYPLGQHQANISEEDVHVDLSSWEMQVMVGSDVTHVKGKLSGGQRIEALSGELCHDIRVPLSWWEVTYDEYDAPWLALYLVKRMHKGWTGPWFAGALNPHRRQTFSWNAYQPNEIKTEEDTLAPKKSGAPEDLDKQLCSGAEPTNLCTGVDMSEDEWHAYITLHLDDAAVELASGRIPMEELFSADISHDSIAVFLRNEGLNLCYGSLKGSIEPQFSSWEVKSVRRWKLPKNCNIRCPAFYNRALCIKLVKAQGAQYLWDGVLENPVMPEFELPRERMSWTERVQRALVLAPGAPLKEHVKIKRAAEMCVSIDCSQDTVTRRANITLHLFEGLEELAEKYRVDLETFFALKVSEDMIEVNIVADCEYVMCVGALGGKIKQEKTTWEISREKSSVNDKQEHLVLKISVAKAEGSTKRWDEVFRKMEPWEVQARMLSLADSPDDQNKENIPDHPVKQQHAESPADEVVKQSVDAGNAPPAAVAV